MKSLPPRMLVQSKIEIGLVDQEKNIKLISLTYFRYFTIILYLPVVRGVALHLKKPEFPVSKNALCQVWLKLAYWFWWRRWACEKFTDGRTDKRRTIGYQKSSLELSAQVSQ